MPSNSVTVDAAINRLSGSPDAENRLTSASSALCSSAYLSARRPHSRRA